ncbi:hypothetical protein ACR6C2_13105 [Streptomyces sp. INA 01156]
MSAAATRPVTAARSVSGPQPTYTHPSVPFTSARLTPGTRRRAASSPRAAAAVPGRPVAGP